MTHEKQITGVKKPTRSISGVTPLTVVLKPRKCNHGTCIYCPGGDKVPQSYTDKSPAIMRALTLNFDITKQVQARLNSLKLMNHPTDKIEIIILGGTFLQYDSKYQEEVIKKTYDVLNEKPSKNLEEAKKINETAQHRIVALCIENRPDNCSEKEIKRMLEFGTTRIELGIQMPDDEIYKKIARGHTVKDVIEATQRLKDAGFKIGYHIMPGLPGSNPEKDITLFKKIFDNEEFRPDQLKIYPCQVIDGSPLVKLQKVLKYKPYDENTTKKVVEEMMKLIPEYCRVMRIMREIPKEKIVDGIERLDLRKDLEDELRENKSKIQEIRMREIGFNQNNVNKNIKIKVLEYKASKGKEFFLQFVNKDNILFGLLRLRFPHKTFIPELKNTAIVREIHVYGQALNLNSNNQKEAIQHHGLGKQLMKLAENIAKKHSYKKIAVISGVGVREYYKKLGYNLEGSYMVKKL